MKKGYVQPGREASLVSRAGWKNKQYELLAERVQLNPGQTLGELSKSTGYSSKDLVQRLLKAGCVQRKGRWYPR